MTNVHLLPKESLSLLSSMLNSFFEKLKNNQRISSLNNGLEVSKPVIKNSIHLCTCNCVISITYSLPLNPPFADDKS